MLHALGPQGHEELMLTVEFIESRPLREARKIVSHLLSSGFIGAIY
jgi:hypothetical protein